MGTNNEANVKRPCLSALDTIDLASCERSLKRMTCDKLESKKNAFLKTDRTLGFGGMVCVDGQSNRTHFLLCQSDW